jgi:hypothetical protein
MIVGDAQGVRGLERNMNRHQTRGISWQMGSKQIIYVPLFNRVGVPRVGVHIFFSPNS